MPTPRLLLSWRQRRIRLLLPMAVHGVAGAGAMYLVASQPWAWLWLALVACSAALEIRDQRRAFSSQHALLLLGHEAQIDGVTARIIGAWLGPRWTVIRLRLSGGRGRSVALYRSELGGADHAAVRRHLKQLDFDDVSAGHRL